MVETGDIKALIMDEASMNRAITRIAHEIIEKNNGADNIVLIGIKRRGVPLAKRISGMIGIIENEEVETGELDITFYRDDLSRLSNQPVINSSDIRSDIDGKKVILVDDVIYTGRTVRAAIEAIFDKGRPACVQLAVLIDRGHRELPFRADFVGKNVPTKRSEIVAVNMKETDGTDCVTILDTKS